jgi:endonuclease/exonuclease/phosphatase family metal-dependent hydrolase
LKIVTYNIQFGMGRDGNFDLDRIVRVIADADIIALQEVDVNWDRSGNVDQCAKIAEALPEHYYVYGANVDVLKSRELKNGRVDNRRRQFGNAILSRYPILSSRNLLYPKFGASNAHAIQRGAVEATLDTPLGVIRAYSTHLCHLSSKQRCKQILQLLETSRNAPSEGPVESGGTTKNGWNEIRLPQPPDQAIFMGDFNLSYDSAEYELLVGPKSEVPNQLESVRLSGFGNLVDAWVAAGNAESEGVSLPIPGKTGAGPRIDYAFLTRGLAGYLSSASIDPDADGSDHQPFFMELNTAERTE